jgi:putative MATE family efflux protein
MSHHNTDLKTGSIRGHLVRMTIPMIWGIAAIISFQLVDTYYISLLGTRELAAMSFTFPVTLFVFSIIMGFGISMSSVVSRLIGEGKIDDVRRVTTHGIILVFGVGCGIAIAGFLSRDIIFEMMGANEDMRDLIHQYMTIWFLGVPFMATPFVGNSAIRASGSAIAPAVIMVGVALFNAALAPFLVFGIAGFPRLELQGAAIATVLSNIIAMISGLYILGWKKGMMLSPKSLQLEKFGDSAKRLMFIAIAAGLTSAIGPLVNSYIISILAKYGDEAVAAFGIASRVEAFCFIILMALAVGMGPVIGQNFGARQLERVEETLKNAIGFGVGYCLAISIILTFFAEPIASVFSSDATVVYYAKMAFLVIAPTYLFASLISGWSSAFNAMGRPQISLVITLIRMVVMTIPAVMIGAKTGGVYGVFMAIAAVNIFCSVIFHLWARKSFGAFKWNLALKTP